MSPPALPFTELLTFLGHTQIFAGLPPEQLADIAQLARREAYRKGEILFHQGDNGNGFYVVRSGRVKVFKLSNSGKEQILHIFGEGDHIAEVPAFDGQPFPASAEAISTTEALFFPRQFFLSLLEQNPALAINMLKSFARHMRRFSQLVDNLSLREVPGRLATYLLQLSAQSGDADIVTLDLNKGQLAAMLGTIPETLSRVLYKLSSEGAIAVNGNTIQILDRERLKQLSS
jgi:CRP-like cAMP-binding protein